ncbi:hypothetical protein [Klebsiella variicola]|uniref:hypothetical protein n=1 Tax=Klebsiella variicola TaxID=244366 RepID=UPI000ACEF379|nr:hypothetical protein [Klebsiella variicola]MBP5848407.1 hypothetical protein [Klebsiella variicola]MCE0521003.1 hypothetical protein [Klebsiella variicola]
MSFERTVKVNPTKLYQELAGLQIQLPDEEVTVTYTAFRLESIDTSTKLASVCYRVSLDDSITPGGGYVNFVYENSDNLLEEAEAHLQKSFEKNI